MELAAKEAFLVMQRRLLCMTSTVRLCIKQGLFALQGSLVCGTKTIFLRLGDTLLFAHKRPYQSNDMAIRRLHPHTVFCEIAVGFPSLRVWMDFGAVGNANIRQAGGQCAILCSFRRSGVLRYFRIMPTPMKIQHTHKFSPKNKKKRYDCLVFENVGNLQTDTRIA